MSGPTVGTGGAHPNYFHQVDFLLTKRKRARFANAPRHAFPRTRIPFHCSGGLR